MSLKQSIVVVNEFTVKTKNGGSRGGTPGSYVERYMARDTAIESVMATLPEDGYVLGYMARETATDVQPKQESDPRDGISFGNDCPSLSYKDLKKRSKIIQKAFDSKKTVLKTVLSFDEAYLKAMHIVEPDFTLVNRGDYRGKIDQMKLRLAIMNGLKNLAHDFDNLQYVGVIQVDTAHVHCHLAMVDTGVGNLKSNGQQVGKLTAKQMRNIRRGIDNYLDEKQTVKQLCINRDKSKQSVIDRTRYEAMANEGFSQLLMACLPKNKNHWRANTNRKDMQKANALCRNFCMDVLSQNDSGYRKLLSDIDKYARERAQRDGMTDEEYRKLYFDGQERVIRDCMNSIYTMLKSVPDEDKVINTPMLDVMAMPYEDAASIRDEMVEFGFRLRSYSSRKEHHKAEMQKWHNFATEYENLPSGKKSKDSEVLYFFYREEEEYNKQCFCKYQHFLSFLPQLTDYDDRLEEIKKYKSTYENTVAMCKDKRLKAMLSDDAEAEGIKRYGVTGGKNIDTVRMEPMIQKRKMIYENALKEFRFELLSEGLYCTDDNQIIKQLPYTFDEVKALDLHHMEYDFPYDLEISYVNLRSFIEATNKRKLAYDKAVYYLKSTGQSTGILPEYDVEKMVKLSDALQSNPVLPTAVINNPEYKHKPTVTLDTNYQNQMAICVKNTVASELAL